MDRERCDASQGAQVCSSRVARGGSQGADESIYAQKKDKLSVEDRCVLWGTRIVLPPQLRAKIIDEIHKGHLDIGRMKSFARSLVATVECRLGKKSTPLSDMPENEKDATQGSSTVVEMA